MEVNAFVRKLNIAKKNVMDFFMLKNEWITAPKANDANFNVGIIFKSLSLKKELMLAEN